MSMSEYHCFNNDKQTCTKRVTANVLARLTHMLCTVAPRYYTPHYYADLDIRRCVVSFALPLTSIVVAGFDSTVCKLQSRFTNTPRVRIR